jgi:osmoprotectant transport system permease protein
VPLGVLAAKVRAAGQPILAAVGVIQTIPSLALLAFLIAALGRIGTVPALVALFLYALLPIVRNTHAGIGTATIAAFIGAGGYGERIVQGLALNDHTILIAGALPAAALALLVQGAFELAERRSAWRRANGDR